MPNTLTHHFGSKEQLLSEILNGVRDRLRQMYAGLEADPAEDPLQRVWAWTSGPDRLPFFRSFFEAYGLALRQPDQLGAFLQRVVTDWLPTGNPARATLELALLRGLLLDLLTTGDRERVDSALALYARSRGRRRVTEAGNLT
jgi:AcrR family transcriptional regulator